MGSNLHLSDTTARRNPRSLRVPPLAVDGLPGSAAPLRTLRAGSLGRPGQERRGFVVGSPCRLCPVSLCVFQVEQAEMAREGYRAKSPVLSRPPG